MMGQEDPSPIANCQLPIALGVIRRVETEAYDAAVNQQINEVREKSKVKTFDQLTTTLEQWTL